MTKTKLLIITVLALTLTILLSGCASGGIELEGKSIVTFETNGGTINYGTSSTNNKVNFAYHPGTYVVDPLEMPNYSITRKGYNFTGWYTSADCKPNEKWNFATLLEAEELTLYAGWEKAIKYSFTLYYTDGDKSVSLGSYNVSAAEKFEDWRNFASGRDGYTPMGYYSDAACTVAWDFTTAHPGGESDLDIPVYVSYIEGDWILVDSYEKLKSALTRGNVYLTSDIDCGGADLSVTGTYDRIFEGNGFTVSNFNVKQGGTTISPNCTIFGTLGKNAEIRNVNFEGAAFNMIIPQISSGTIKINVMVSALALDMLEGAKVSNVSVSGTIKTNYDGEFKNLSDAVFGAEGKSAEIIAGITEFVANITVDKQS